MWFPELAVGTSIAPKRIEEQAAALDSWRAMTHTILSVNSAEEIRLLRDHFPFVMFIEACRDGATAAGKPYVFLDDVLAATRATGSSYLGIINSDITLVPDERTRQLVLANVENSFIFGQRIEIERGGAEGGHYFGGFDFFLFDSRLAAQLSGSEFLLGVPWWDFWLPLEVLARHGEIKNLIAPFAHHRAHAVKWSQDHYSRYGRHLLEKLAQLAQNHGLDARFLDCIEAGADVGLTPLNALVLGYLKAHSTHLAVDDGMARRYFQNEMNGAFHQWHGSAWGLGKSLREQNETIRELRRRPVAPRPSGLDSFAGRILSGRPKPPAA